MHSRGRSAPLVLVVPANCWTPLTQGNHHSICAMMKAQAQREPVSITRGPDGRYRANGMESDALATWIRAANNTRTINA